MHILVADDDLPSVKLTSFLLEEAGYRVFKAYDGPSILQVVEQYNPDLVLLDVSMLAIDPDGSAGSAEAAGRAAAAFHQGGWDAPWITGLELRTGSGQADSQLDGVYSQSAVFTTAVGQTVHLVGDLSLSFNHRSSTLARDWSSGYTHGAAIYRIDVLTPDVDVSTGSGFDYATPVPEPRTWALMLAGLCAVGLSVRRRAA